MRVDRSVWIGWTWFGLGMVRFYIDADNWYTMWMLFLTNKFAIGVHFGGKPRQADSKKKSGSDMCVLCERCGKPTMHIGSVCYSCCHKE
jgi:hypothetical protein